MKTQISGPQIIQRENAERFKAHLIEIAPLLIETLEMALANIPRPTLQSENCAERLAVLAHIQDVIDMAKGVVK